MRRFNVASKFKKETILKMQKFSFTGSGNAQGTAILGGTGSFLQK